MADLLQLDLSQWVSVLKVYELIKVQVFFVGCTLIHVKKKKNFQFGRVLSI